MKKLALIAMLVGCCPVVPCRAPTGTVLETPCAGVEDGKACCLGASVGTCKAGECLLL